MPLQPERADALSLLVSELVTVSVKHAVAARADEISVAFAARGGCVRVQVSDPGRKGPPEVSARPDDVSGFGFYLVDKLADRWGFTEGRIPGLWFEMDVYRLEPMEA